jgi:hypothetical protein
MPADAAVCAASSRNDRHAVTGHEDGDAATTRASPGYLSDREASSWMADQPSRAAAIN